MLVFLQDSNSGTAGCLGEMFENRDAVFVLAYSIMMLNTDLHNEQNKKKMTLNVSVGGVCSFFSLFFSRS